MKGKKVNYFRRPEREHSVLSSSENKVGSQIIGAKGCKNKINLQNDTPQENPKLHAGSLSCPNGFLS